MFRLTIIFCLIFSAGFPGVFADVVVVMSSDSNINSLSQGQLQGIFLGKETFWGDGKRIILTTNPSGPSHREFLDRVVQQSPRRYSNYWKRAVFTGRGNPPKSFSNEEDLVRYIVDNPGAIGYVQEDWIGEDSELKDSLQVVYRTR